jgi:hypothetical protein
MPENIHIGQPGEIGLGGGIPKSALFRLRPSWCSGSGDAFFESSDLLCDIGPVIGRDLLANLVEQGAEVVQAGDRRATAIIEQGGVLSQGAKQDCMFDIGDGNTVAIELAGEFLIGGCEGTADTTPLEEQALDLVDVAGQVTAGGAHTFIWPEPIGDLDSSGRAELADTFLNQFIETVLDLGAGSVERPSEVGNFGKDRALASVGMQAEPDKKLERRIG